MNLILSKEGEYLLDEGTLEKYKHQVGEWGAALSPSSSHKIPLPEGGPQGPIVGGPVVGGPGASVKGGEWDYRTDGKEDYTIQNVAETLADMVGVIGEADRDKFISAFIEKTGLDSDAKITDDKLETLFDFNGDGKLSMEELRQFMEEGEEDTQ